MADEKPKTAKSKGRVDKNKIRFLFGLAALTASFLCVVAIFYLFVRQMQDQTSRLEALKEEMGAVDAERTAAREKAEELKQQVGKFVSVSDLVKEAERTYGPEEGREKAGLLWIDRSASQWIVTLGVQNGLQVGSRLAVYNNGTKVDTVVVELPLDVISYVQPTPKLKGQFENDYFRVAGE